MLDINVTIFIQFINFVIAVFVLNILIIRPIREIIKKRNGIMDDLAGEADKFHSEAVSRLEAYEAQLAEARKQAGENRQEGKDEGLAELQAIVGNAQQNARKLLEENRKTIEGQAEAALSELRNGIDNFSTMLGNKLINGN